MKRLILIIVILLVANSLKSQITFLPMKYDSPLTKNSGHLFGQYDKLDHFTGSALLTMVIPTRKYNLDLWLSISAGLLFEINDGRAVNVKRTCGFSRTDLIADVAGAIMGMWLKDILYNKGIYVLVNKNGLSIHF